MRAACSRSAPTAGTPPSRWRRGSRREAGSPRARSIRGTPRSRGGTSRARLDDRITVHLGPALETIELLEGDFDLVFIDADKVNYRNYDDATVPRLSDRGLIAIDNTLWSGRVLGEAGEESTRAIVDFNEHVRGDPSVASVMLTVRDGVTLVRRVAPDA